MDEEAHEEATKRKIDNAVIAATAIVHLLARLDTDEDGKLAVLRMAQSLIAFSEPRRPHSLGEVIGHAAR